MLSREGAAQEKGWDGNAGGEKCSENEIKMEKIGIKIQKPRRCDVRGLFSRSRTFSIGSWGRKTLINIDVTPIKLLKTLLNYILTKWYECDAAIGQSIMYMA